MPYGLNENTLIQLKQLFQKYNQIEEVILYGSRAKGNYSEGSDVDLVLKGSTIEFENLRQLQHDIDNLLLPWLFDIGIFKEIKNKELIDHIQRVGIPIYKQAENKKETN